MIDGIFAAAYIFTILGWIGIPMAVLGNNDRMFKYLLPTTICFSIFTVIWTIFYG
ncbi:hypothetical protein ST201phi2-1p348 [Pseudomonas phage 201phi2-1]|uniref:Uncharacterized protein n=1 Tax=Pseudomonas phage 201phi2-1 TaxID=198110 RepID=B3FJK9_BP201|nr:hypothetical protein ST201phi2-1p348 [Pseudomonas phage 201phi2-1]ABY63174.1 hypothetical protein 201phi2-1p348 [Pseudomonas phage 201phi2-1]